jgi:glycine dehydrogenase subunit 2
MIEFLPRPHVEKTQKDGSDYYSFENPLHSVGPIKSFYGQFGIILRAWAYLKTYGKDITKVSERAVLNANYMAKHLGQYLVKASNEPVMHEVVFTQESLKKFGITTKHFAKSLLERGFYAPTIYFPLHVDGAMMVEPTETESKREMDAFIHAVKDIFAAMETNPDSVRNAPSGTFITHIDETLAARTPILTWNQE